MNPPQDTLSYPISSYTSLADHLEEKPDEPPFFKLPLNTLWDGFKTISEATLSTSLSLIYIYAVNLISLAFIGQLEDPSMIGGLGLGFVCSNCGAYVLISSINQGVNVLAAQAFGANKHSLVSLSYHRGLFILLILMIPILIFLWFSQPLLIFFGIGPLTAQYAWEYILSAFPSFLFYGVFDCTKSYLYAQNIFKPVLFTQTATTIFHFLWSWLFIYQLGLGPSGAGIAKCIFEFSNMLIIMIYIYASKCCASNWIPPTKIQWRRKVMKWNGMKIFLGTVIPIAALLFLDMACYEIFTMLAGQFDDYQLAIHVAIANTVTLYYSVPFGISISVMTYVANAMGKSQPNAAKNYTYIGVILNGIVTVGFVLLLLLCKDAWANLFSTNNVMKNLLLDVLKIYFIFIFVDGVQVVLSGTLKGIGKQTAATIGLFISYYVLAIPFIYFLAFKLDLKVKGIWYGFLTGIFILFVMYVVLLATSNFRKQAKEVQKSLILASTRETISNEPL